MLLSRALNRGYGSSRARWPIEYGLLNQDALWVMDEVQLMDVGLATSAQLQAYREEDKPKSFKQCHTWWMSATLQPDWLSSVDTEASLPRWSDLPCVVPANKRTGGLFNIRKKLTLENIEAKDSKRFAELVYKEHQDLATGEHGRITLVVCNTVKRACETYDQIRTKDKNQAVELVHSRFRPYERQRWRKDFLSKDACTPDADRIIVATQVVEAGVDISAGCLITELAPWPSLVQRFGRCARYGGEGTVIVVNRGCDAKASPPYTEEQLTASFESLQELTDVGITELEKYEETLSTAARARLFPYSPQHLLMRTEFDELFDTTPDLTGADIDIGRFIRSGDERDLQIFWIDVDRDAKPSGERKGQRHELCAVKFTDARNWLCGEETKSSRKPNLSVRMQNRAWIWDWIDGDWVTAKRADLLPGRIVCVAGDRGGYSLSRGFDPDSKDVVPEIKVVTPDKSVKDANTADGQQDNEQMSFTGWKTIAFHSSEVEQLIREIADRLELNDDLKGILGIAALWHDVGKAHPAFQAMLRSVESPTELSDVMLAKSNRKSAGRARYFADPDGRDERIGFRHELASALALFAVLQTYQPDHAALLGPWADWLTSQTGRPESFRSSGTEFSTSTIVSCPASVQKLLDCSAEEFDLILYLVASHHGKVRAALYASPADQEYSDRVNDGRGLPIRGVREGDRLPPVDLDNVGQSLPELTLTLEPAAMGLSRITGRSWRERTEDVVQCFGPTQLAYLESILRAADVRASKLNTQDPSIGLEQLR
jgi:CRISPR-associated endonuclease/helicase Cas3